MQERIISTDHDQGDFGLRARARNAIYTVQQLASRLTDYAVIYAMNGFPPPLQEQAA